MFAPDPISHTVHSPKFSSRVPEHPLFNQFHIFHVVHADFPINSLGIVGSEFLAKTQANIDFATQCVTVQNQQIPFADRELILVPAKSVIVAYVKVTNVGTKEGYYPRLDIGENVYARNCVTKIEGGKAPLRIFNCSEEEFDMIIPAMRLEEFEEAASKRPLMDNIVVERGEKGLTRSEREKYPARTKGGEPLIPVTVDGSAKKNKKMRPLEPSRGSCWTNKDTNSSRVNHIKCNADKKAIKLIEMMKLDHLNNEELKNIKELVHNYAGTSGRKVIRDAPS